MPNHIANLITIYGSDERIKEIMDKIKVNDETYGFNTIDFEKVIPMPEALRIEAGSNTYRGIKAYLAAMDPRSEFRYDLAKKQTAEYVDDLANKLGEKIATMEDIEKYEESNLARMLLLGKQAIENYLEYGYKDWYDWSCAVWGTKWNAYDFVEREYNQLNFSTAWEPCLNISQRLSEQYPDVEIVHQYSDEFIGDHAGEYHFKAGTISQTLIPDAMTAGTIDLYKETHCCDDVDIEEYNLIPSYNGKYWLWAENTELKVCYVGDTKCLYDDYHMGPDDVPAGFYTYFYEDNTDGLLCKPTEANNGGLILSNVPLDKNTKISDITFTDEKENVYDFKNN